MDVFKSNFKIGSITETPSGRHFSGHQLQEQVNALAEKLRALHPKPHQIVFLYEKNSAAFFIQLFACWQLELCAVPVDSQIPEIRKQGLIEKFSPRFTIGSNFEISEMPSEKTAPEASLGLLTSGSTGQPKTILHSAKALKNKMAALNAAIPNEQIENSLCFLPTFFGHGLVCNSLFPLLSGRNLFISEPFSIAMATQLSDIVKKYQINFFSSTPVVWSMLERFPSEAMPSLKRIHCASAPLDSSRIRIMKEWAPNAQFWNVYGMTEFLGWVGGGRIDQEAAPGSVGRPWGCEMRVDNEANEVQIRANYVQLGFSDWYSTGDIGEIAANGSLILKGRKDFLINKGGLKIQPEEVETVATQFPEVASACCIGIPDTFAGQKVALAIVPRDPLTFGENDAERLRAFLSTQLTSYKIPDRIFIVNELPVTNRGKMDRAAVIRLIASRPEAI